MQIQLKQTPYSVKRNNTPSFKESPQKLLNAARKTHLCPCTSKIAQGVPNFFVKFENKLKELKIKTSFVYEVGKKDNKLPKNVADIEIFKGFSLRKYDEMINTKKFGCKEKDCELAKDKPTISQVAKILFKDLNVENPSVIEIQV